jgi:hypothetical protein
MAPLMATTGKSSHVSRQPTDRNNALNGIPFPPQPSIVRHPLRSSATVSFPFAESDADGI